MKKRSLALALVILAALAAVWLARGQTLFQPTEYTNVQTTESAVTSGAGQDELTAETNGTTPASHSETSPATDGEQNEPDEHGIFSTKEEIVAYLSAYGHLPENYITKEEARALGWNGGGLDDFRYGACIGGDRFGNYEGLLPETDGRTYTECDIGTLHRDSRGAKRIVFSNDGLIYYTDDHYESFTLLAGTP
ncbi:MAG: ribonuclease domain-containing protein [Eubacteriales bacterium]|nr:ribonuclease domain-containing protein [Eubacteriales bacterium]